MEKKKKKEENFTSSFGCWVSKLFNDKGDRNGFETYLKMHISWF
jgi:hypothetical protein